MNDGNGEIQTAYQETLLYAAGRHALRNQTLPDSDIPYVVHLSDVCMEILIAGQYTENFDLELAVRVALLHDVLEEGNHYLAERLARKIDEYGKYSLD